MFQEWFLEIMSLISDIIVGFSAIAVAVFAYIGLRQWKTELSGKSKYKVAKKMAKLAFEFRDRYHRARSLFTSLSESTNRVMNNSEIPEETNLLNEYYARNRRLEPLQNTLSKLYEANWEAEIILDNQIGKLIRPLDSAFRELYASIESYFAAKIDQIGHNRESNVKLDWLDTHFHRIYGQDDENSQAIDVSTQLLVDKLKTYL